MEICKEPLTLYNNSTVFVGLTDKVAFKTHNLLTRHRLGAFKTYYDTQYPIDILLRPNTELILFSNNKTILKNKGDTNKIHVAHWIGIINSIIVKNID
jgi:hypothetical protein